MLNYNGEYNMHKFVSPKIIGERMKPREKIHDVFVQPWEYMCMRFDGHTFSTFTNGFHKPFDHIFMTAMERTTHDVVAKFTATLGYVQSDEITLIFAPLCTQKEYDECEPEKKPTRDFSGRKDKLLTLIASYISVRFNFHIISLIDADDYTENFVNKVNACEQHFDGRLLIFANDEYIELLNYFVWRINDCYRNTVSSYARHTLNKKDVHKKNTSEMMADISFDFQTAVDTQLQFGCFVKKEIYTKTDIDRVTGDIVDVTRHRTVSHVIDVSATDEFAYLVNDKYWPMTNIDKKVD
jgi:tRNA(His) guanylyltransferase